MGDSLANFSDLSYYGLTDTGTGFTGSSTMQDVQLGSPVLLDSSYGSNDASSVLDQLSVPYIDSTSTQNTVQAQQLSGVTDPPFLSSAQSTPTPNTAPPSPNVWAGLTALSKLGAGFANMFAQPAPTVAGAPRQMTTPAGAMLPPGAASGTLTVVAIVMIGALILLLLRED